MRKKIYSIKYKQNYKRGTKMRGYILQGIYDYVKDCYHDHLMAEAKAIGCVLYDKATKYKKNTIHIPANRWKEGSVWFYIKQRRIAKDVLCDRKQSRKQSGHCYWRNKKSSKTQIN